MRSTGITLLVASLLLLTLGCGGDKGEGGSGGAGKPAVKAPPKPALRYQFAPGTALRYRITSDTDVAGMMPVKQNEVQEQTWAVKEVDAEGNATVDVTFDAVKMHVENPMLGVVEYDSAAADPEEEPHPGVAQEAVFVGKTVTLTLTPLGEVLTASGAEKIAEEFAGNPMAEMMKGMFTNDVVKGRLQSSIMKLPAEEMKAGGEWTDSLTTPLGMAGEVKMDLSSKVKSIDEVEGNTIATIENSAVIDTSAIKLPENNPMASQMKFSEGKVSGEWKFDMTNGQLVVSRTVTTMALEMMGQRMEVKVTSSTERID